MTWEDVQAPLPFRRRIGNDTEFETNQDDDFGQGFANLT
jgi:hypothetical protein